MTKECNKESKKDNLIYNEYKEKYNLPDFKELKIMLEIECINDKELFFNQIKKKISEKIAKYIEILDSIIQPDTTISTMYEIKYISEQDRLIAFEIYKKLMYYYRSIQLLELENNHQKDSELIISFYNEFNILKNKISKIIEKQKECWKNNDNIKKDVLAYFG
jgi:hypothetical protein